MAGLLLKLLIVALIVYAIYRIVFGRMAPRPETVSDCRSERGFAFLSNGLLFYRQSGGELKQVHSAYAQEAIDRREQLRDRHGWKQGTSFNVAAGGGSRSFEASSAAIQMTTAAFEPNGNLLYFLKNENMGGLFRYETATGKELRILFRQNMQLGDLTPSPDGTTLAAASQHEGGVVNIILFDNDGNNYREVTGGDTVDTAPAWIPGVPNRLLFQSSGLARNEEGYIIAQAPASIQKLDMDLGSVSPILDDPGFDHLKPRVTQAGDLLYIRRPYQGSSYGIGSILSDTLLFPFRLLRATFHYLNFFSLMYTRKPLTSANGPTVKADIKNILLQGRRIDAEKALRSARPVQGVPSLVPDSWQLISRNQNGEERVLATNVATYDISPDGSIVYSNGRGVFELDQDGSSRLAHTEELVAEVVAGIA
jgi:hypothetical protein